MRCSFVIVILQLASYAVIQKAQTDSNNVAGSSDDYTGPSDDHTGPSDDHTGPSDDHTGSSDDHTGSSDDHTGASSNQSQTGHDYCSKDELGRGCTDAFRLQRREFSKEVQESVTVNIQDKEYSIKTLSLTPPIYEIQSFLTDAEADRITQVAEEVGLEESSTQRNFAGRGVHLMDVNGDKKLNLSEMRLTLEDAFDYYLLDEDILEMYKVLKLDKNGDNSISETEMEQLRPKEFLSYLKNYVIDHPELAGRRSSQAWLPNSTEPSVRKIVARIDDLLRLPPRLIEKSDLQIVKYHQDGHYHAHHDSEPLRAEVPCCNRKLTNGCRICRFATVMLYLSDVQGGGQTAFPVADSATYDVTTFRLSHVINLREHCRSAGLLVAPRKGNAVFWYNHDVDVQTGWLGELDELTWHGGCPVGSGVKWIANLWVKVTDDKNDDMTF